MVGKCKVWIDRALIIVRECLSRPDKSGSLFKVMCLSVGLKVIDL